MAYKYFINNIIDQIINHFFFKSRMNNTPMNLSFESDEFGPTNLTLKFI